MSDRGFYRLDAVPVTKPQRTEETWSRVHCKWCLHIHTLHAFVWLAIVYAAFSNGLHTEIIWNCWSVHSMFDSQHQLQWSHKQFRYERAYLLGLKLQKMGFASPTLYYGPPWVSAEVAHL